MNNDTLASINIITTAALPWRTGTAINPLLRAYTLACKSFEVSIYLPWVPPRQQKQLFGADITFDDTSEQIAYISQYLPTDSEQLNNLHIRLYPAFYLYKQMSIMPKYPLAKYITNCDWLILEEPEHLGWLYPLSHYRQKASWITGILHTNYAYYLKYHIPAPAWLKALFERYSQWLVQWHCDDVVRLGENLASFRHAQCLDVNGVHPAFFTTPMPAQYRHNAYFIGKLVWAKGWRELIDLLAQSDLRELDVFGDGDDKADIDIYAQQRGIMLRHHGVSCNPASDLSHYKIFINCSRSEVACSTTAEALVQGRFVIIPNDVSNRRFQGYKNCLLYNTPQVFCQQLQFALKNEPQADCSVNNLSFDAATERLLALCRQNRKYFR